MPLAYMDSRQYGSELTKRARLLQTLQSLKQGRLSYEEQWLELATFILPENLRLLVTDINDGRKKRQLIMDATATRASNTLVSGMQAGITNESLDWFQLTAPHPKMLQIPGVDEWLFATTEAMRFVFSQSNFYQIMPMLYEDIGTFGTGCALIEESMETAIHLTHFPVGSFWISSNWKGQTNCFGREFQLTVWDLVEEFGLRDGNQTADSIDWDRFSTGVKSLWDNKDYFKQIEVTHMITPNEDFIPGDDRVEHKRFCSDYFESSQNATANPRPAAADEAVYLREAGYDYFPVLAPKWSVRGGDWYGSNSPGMLSLPDVKMLQKLQMRKLKAIDKMVDPPMTGPTKLRTAIASTQPGKKTYVDVYQGQKGFEPAYMVDPRIMEVRQDIMQAQNKISDFYMESTFLALTRSQQPQPRTATEVNEITQEKNALIGPLLGRLNVDCLGPAIDITFYQMNDLGLVPPPPEELAGMPLKVVYVSALAQTQKFVAAGAIDKFVGFMTGLAALDQTIPQKMNSGSLVDQYADILGLSPGSIKSEQEFQAVMAQIAKQRQAAMLAEQAQKASQTGKNLSQSQTSDGQNLLDALQTAQQGA